MLSFRAPLSLVGLAAMGLLAQRPTLGQSAVPAVISQLAVQVQSGAAPIAGATLQLYQADLTSNTPVSIPLLSSPALTNGNGVYTLSGITCAPGALYYLAATGGDAGSGSNPAIALMIAVGSCQTLSTTSTVVLNEATTVASVYALSGFMTAIANVGAKATPAANGSANDALLAGNALSGITNAFVTANNLVDITTGIVRTATIPGNGTVPQSEINTLANALAGCVESTGFSSSACTTLFANTPSRTAAAPRETVQASLNIAHNPSANVTALYALANAATTVPPVPCKKPPTCSFAVRQTALAPYGPVLATSPHDWTIVVPYTGGGVSDALSMAVDATGNVWIANAAILNASGTMGIPLTASVSEFANNGAILSGAGYKAPSFGFAIGISIDPSGNAWAAAYGSKNIVEFAPNGSVLFNYTNSYFSNVEGLAIDGSGNVWVPLDGPGDNFANVAKFANGGTLLTNIPGYVLANSDIPYAIAIDQTGSAWITNYADGNVSKLDAQGNRLSGLTGFTSPSLGLYPTAIAIDASGNAWVESGPSGTLTEFSSSGTVLSGSTGYPICISGATVQCTSSFFVNASIAIDGAGNLWVPLSYNAVINGRTSSSTSSGLAELNSSGTILSGPSGYANDTAITVGNIAIDNSGNLWSVSAKNIVREVIGAAVPVVTPLSVGVETAMLGCRP